MGLPEISQFVHDRTLTKNDHSAIHSVYLYFSPAFDGVGNNLLTSNMSLLKSYRLVSRRPHRSPILGKGRRLLVSLYKSSIWSFVRLQSRPFLYIIFCFEFLFKSVPIHTVLATKNLSRTKRDNRHFCRPRGDWLNYSLGKEQQNHVTFTKICYY